MGVGGGASSAEQNPLNVGEVTELLLHITNVQGKEMLNVHCVSYNFLQLIFMCSEYFAEKFEFQGLHEKMTACEIVKNGFWKTF